MVPASFFYMRRVTLKGGVEVSQLCFGTANLGRLPTKRAVLRTLAAAHDAGMTHFDTARLYGHGTMERTVGEFLRGKRDRVTVTTKFGLDPLLRSGRLRPLLNAAKFIVKKIPLLRQRAVRFAQAKASNAAVADRREVYSRARAERALEESLRELGTDTIDLYLLHEANPENDVSEGLLEFLQDRRAAGVIRALGVGSAYETLHAASQAARAAYDVLQFESTVQSPNVRALAAEGDCSLITHGVFHEQFTLVEAGKRHPEIARRHAGILGRDPTDPRNVSRWLLGYALQANPAGAVLISTVQAARIVENVRVAEAPPEPTEIAAFEDYAREVTNAP